MTTESINKPTWTKPEGICETCGGAGWIEEKHPRWGSSSCPEPYVDVPCPDCNKGGFNE